MNISRKHIILIILACFSLIIILILSSTLLNQDKLSTTSNSNTNQQNTNPIPSTVSLSDFISIKECLGKSDEAKCMDKFVEGYIGSKTIKEVLYDLEISRAKDTTVEDQCHPIAHAVGRRALTQFKTVGDAFEACDQTCHSGCYHGVMERLLYSEDDSLEGRDHLTYEDLKDKIPTICSNDKFKNPTNAVIFQCLHGVGHAILYSLDYNLRDSLKACDLLPTEYDRTSCYGGVVMENITAFDKKKRDLKREDNHYPCNSINEKYRQSCYLMQTSVMFEYGLSIEQIANECKNANGNQYSCFTSLGRDLSNSVRLGKADRVVEACEEYSTGFERHCIDGTIYALIDNTWNAEFAFPFCNSLKKTVNIEYCYKDATTYLRYTYNMGNFDLENNCSQYAKENVSFCKDVITQVL